MNWLTLDSSLIVNIVIPQNVTFSFEVNVWAILTKYWSYRAHKNIQTTFWLYTYSGRISTRLSLTFVIEFEFKKILGCKCDLIVNK